MAGGRKAESIAEVRDDLVSRIREAIPNVLAIYAYGSRVKGGVHAESDLDLALLLPVGQTLQAALLIQLGGDLEALVGCPVQVSVLDLSNYLVHCKEVVAGGMRLFMADDRAVATFEMQTLSNYARLCEDRARVVSSYTVGQAHG
jgi:predicted nucleotidyltransferase